MVVKYEPKVTPWERKESDFPAEAKPEEKARFLLQYAILAPSSHNTQPWKFSVRGNEISIFTDKSRWLKVADADQRELHLSVGCALENLLIAAEHYGYAHSVTYFPDGEEGAAACVELHPGSHTETTRDRILFDMIPQRVTNHNMYEMRRIPVKEIARFHDCCDVHGCRLFATNEADNEMDIRRTVGELIARADAIQFSDPAYKEELSWWIGQGVFGASWLMSKVTQLAVNYLNITKSQTKKDSELLLSAPSLMMLVSTGNDRKAQVVAGQTFERIALTATSLGMALHPMSQILEVPDVKSDLAALIPAKNVYLQHAFRCGYAEPETSHTPRRTLEECFI